VTGPEIQEIRGVNVSGVIKTLLEKRLIVTAGRKAVMGRPIMYRSSKEFLMRFGLSDLEELPSLKEFEQLARAALGSDEGIAPIEPEDTEAAQFLEGSATAAVEPLETSETLERQEGAESVESTHAGGAPETNDAIESVASPKIHSQEPQETPESAQTEAQPAEESKAESAS
jgi:segregation and condensation protein B